MYLHQITSMSLRTTHATNQRSVLQCIHRSQSTIEIELHCNDGAYHCNCHHHPCGSFCGADLYGGVLSVNASLTGGPLRIHQHASCAGGGAIILPGIVLPGIVLPEIILPAIYLPNIILLGIVLPRFFLPRIVLPIFCSDRSSWDSAGGCSRLCQVADYERCQVPGKKKDFSR